MRNLQEFADCFIEDGDTLIEMVQSIQSTDCSGFTLGVSGLMTPGYLHIKVYLIKEGEEPAKDAAPEIQFIMPQDLFEAAFL